MKGEANSQVYSSVRTGCQTNLSSALSWSLAVEAHMCVVGLTISVSSDPPTVTSHCLQALLYKLGKVTPPTSAPEVLNQWLWGLAHHYPSRLIKGEGIMQKSSIDFMFRIFSGNQPPGTHRGSQIARTFLPAFLLPWLSFLLSDFDSFCGTSETRCLPLNAHFKDISGDAQTKTMGKWTI